MVNNLDVKLCLLIFNDILSKGIKREGLYELNGFTAWHDFDGYTCFLKYKQVQLTLMFHGTYDIEYADREMLNAFEKKLVSYQFNG